jgi:peptidoglycan/xylan/chitin deacetylase (PgdA/CDA1 family)
MTARVCFTMDNLSDAADLGRGLIDKPRAPGERPHLEVGFPALLDLYADFGLSITHFIEGWNGEYHADLLQDILKRGHRIGMHGWVHEPWSTLDPDKERELAQRATEALEVATGVRPRAFRAPGGKRTAQTAGILTELGYRIDASESGKEDLQITALSDSLWNIPYRRVCVDATHWLWDDKAVDAVEKLWMQQLETAARQDEYVIFVWHPHVMGVNPDQLELGRKILQITSSQQEFRILTLEALLKEHQAAA